MKKLLAAVLSICMIVGLGVTASAVSAKTYSIAVSGNNVRFTASGTDKTYAALDTNLRLVIDKDNDLLVCFTDKNSKARAISLGSQRSVSISGTLSGLTLDSSVTADVTVTLPTGTTVDKLTNSSSAKVSSANASVGSGSKITTKTPPPSTIGVLPKVATRSPDTLSMGFPPNNSSLYPGFNPPNGTSGYTGDIGSAVVGIKLESNNGLMVGSTLSAVVSVNNANGYALSYAWYRAGPNGNWEQIPSAPYSNYTLTAADQGKQIQVVVTGTGNTAGSVSFTTSGTVAAKQS